MRSIHKQDDTETTHIHHEKHTWRRSNPGKRYSIRGPLPSPAHAATAGTMLFKLCAIPASVRIAPALRKSPISTLRSCARTVSCTSLGGALVPASVQELSRPTVHAVQGKRQPDPFRHT